MYFVKIYTKKYAGGRTTARCEQAPTHPSGYFLYVLHLRSRRHRARDPYTRENRCTGGRKVVEEKKKSDKLKTDTSSRHLFASRKGQTLLADPSGDSQEGETILSPRIKRNVKFISEAQPGWSDSSTESREIAPDTEGQGPFENSLGKKTFPTFEELSSSSTHSPSSTSLLLKLSKTYFDLEKENVFSDFEALARQFDMNSQIIEKLEARIAKKRLLGFNVDSLLKTMDNTYHKLVQKCDLMFTCFSREIVGYPMKKYIKSTFDQSMEDCFGSLDKEGSNVFRYENFCTKVDSSDMANRIFSLYLARKVWCPVHPEKKPESLLSFKERVTSIPPPHPDKHRARIYLKKICERLFFRTDESYRKAPLHDAGCVEFPKTLGGKREYFYLAKDPQFRRSEVIPEAIYTGGKIRVITKDSAYNMKYAFLNTYMGKKIRECNWSIFGTQVEDFLEKNPSFKDLADDEFYVSGDLESATDLFDSSFTEIVLDHIYDLWSEKMGWDETDLSSMKGFTTRANFGKWMQTRGQLMGSILSFPILCLISFVAATFDTPFYRQFMAEKNRKKATNLLKKGDGRTGINGDDVIRKTSNSDLWCEGVKIVGGKVSRGKSLKSRLMFTVNSEIWTCYDGSWCPPKSIRPSLITAMAGSKQIFPQRNWEEFLRSKELSTFFDISKVLAVRIPARFGGLNLERQFYAEEFLFWRELSRLKRIVSVKGLDADAGLSARYTSDYGEENSTSYLVPKEVKKAFARFKYETEPETVRWTVVEDKWSVQVKSARSYAQLMKNDIGTVSQARREYYYWYDLGLENLEKCKMPKSLADSFGGFKLANYSSGKSGVGLCGPGDPVTVTKNLSRDVVALTNYVPPVIKEKETASFNHMIVDQNSNFKWYGTEFDERGRIIKNDGGEALRTIMLRRVLRKVLPKIVGERFSSPTNLSSVNSVLGSP